jgi:phosphopantetheine--protein transferase-like protein
MRNIAFGSKLALGTDICLAKRILDPEAPNLHRARGLMRRVLTPSEMLQAESRFPLFKAGSEKVDSAWHQPGSPQLRMLSHHLAGRFAAKEAAIKAWGQAVSWQNIIISSTHAGKPSIAIQCRTTSAGETTGIRQHGAVSISHDGEYCHATVLGDHLDEELFQMLMKEQPPLGRFRIGLEKTNTSRTLTENTDGDSIEPRVPKRLQSRLTAAIPDSGRPLSPMTRLLSARSRVRVGPGLRQAGKRVGKGVRLEQARKAGSGNGPFKSWRKSRAEATNNEVFGWAPEAGTPKETDDDPLDPELYQSLAKERSAQRLPARAAKTDAMLAPWVKATVDDNDDSSPRSGVSKDANAGRSDTPT